MIHVLATIALNPGTRDAFLKVFKANVPNVLAEDGCLEYGAAVDADTDLSVQVQLGPDAVVVVEKWRDVAALKAHSVAPHMMTYRVAARDYIKSVSIQVLDPA